MRRSLTTVVLVIATVCPAPGQQAGRGGRVAKDEQAVRAVINALAEAGLRRDVAAVDRT
jgi:hypothetical protein